MAVITLQGARTDKTRCAGWSQEHGVRVTVVDRTGVAAGSSWGNAGWIAPAPTLPRIRGRIGAAVRRSPARFRVAGIDWQARKEEWVGPRPMSRFNPLR